MTEEQFADCRYCNFQMYYNWVSIMLEMADEEGMREERKVVFEQEMKRLENHKWYRKYLEIGPVGVHDDSRDHKFGQLSLF